MLPIRSIDTPTEVVEMGLVDTIHKLARFIISMTSLGVGVYLADKGVDPMTIAAVVAPGTAYNYVKGVGNPTVS
jgi:hypothetical protein